MKIKCPSCLRLVNKGDARCYCGHWFRSPFKCVVCKGATTVAIERHQRHNDRILLCAESPGHMRFPAECGFDDEQALLNAASKCPALSKQGNIRISDNTNVE